MSVSGKGIWYLVLLLFLLTVVTVLLTGCSSETYVYVIDITEGSSPRMARAWRLTNKYKCENSYDDDTIGYVNGDDVIRWGTEVDLINKTNVNTQIKVKLPFFNLTLCLLDLLIE